MKKSNALLIFLLYAYSSPNVASFSQKNNNSLWKVTGFTPETRSETPQLAPCETLNSPRSPDFRISPENSSPNSSLEILFDPSDFGFQHPRGLQGTFIPRLTSNPPIGKKKLDRRRQQYNLYLTRLTETLKDLLNKIVAQNGDFTGIPTKLTPEVIISDKYYTTLSLTEGNIIQAIIEMYEKYKTPQEWQLLLELFNKSSLKDLCSLKTSEIIKKHEEIRATLKTYQNKQRNAAQFKTDHNFREQYQRILTNFIFFSELRKLRNSFRFDFEKLANHEHYSSTI